jgi:hypothetical protein
MMKLMVQPDNLYTVKIKFLEIILYFLLNQLTFNLIKNKTIPKDLLINMNIHLNLKTFS